jgi:hypothetical protein
VVFDPLQVVDRGFQFFAIIRPLQAIEGGKMESKFSRRVVAQTLAAFVVLLAWVGIASAEIRWYMYSLVAYNSEIGSDSFQNSTRPERVSSIAVLPNRLLQATRYRIQHTYIRG